jgi:hypothetical protein
MTDDVVEPLVTSEAAQRHARSSNVHLKIKAYVLSIKINEEKQP